MNEQRQAVPHLTLAARLRFAAARNVVAPLAGLLRKGASPRRLAWSLAMGFAVGINPLLGSTTVLCLAVAFVLRLNLVASQISNHIVYPLQLALFFVFIGAGNRVFHSGRMPLERNALAAAVRMHPWTTTRLLWTWEWHALVVWLVLAACITPLLALALEPALVRLLNVVHRAEVATHPTP